MSRFGRASAMGAGPTYLSRVTAADFGPGQQAVAEWRAGGRGARFSAPLAADFRPGPEGPAVSTWCSVGTGSGWSLADREIGTGVHRRCIN